MIQLTRLLCAVDIVLVGMLSWPATTCCHLHLSCRAAIHQVVQHPCQAFLGLPGNISATCAVDQILQHEIVISNMPVSQGLRMKSLDGFRFVSAGSSGVLDKRPEPRMTHTHTSIYDYIAGWLLRLLTIDCLVKCHAFHVKQQSKSCQVDLVGTFMRVYTLCPCSTLQ